MSHSATQINQLENAQDNVPAILKILKALRWDTLAEVYVTPAHDDGSQLRVDFSVAEQVTLSAVEEGVSTHTFEVNPSHLQAWSVLSAFRKHIARLFWWREWAEGPSGSGEKRAEALDRMVACQLTDRKALNLSGLALSSLPAYLPVGYTSLDISNNPFTLELEAQEDGSPSLQLHWALRQGRDGTVMMYFAAMQTMVKDGQLNRAQALEHLWARPGGNGLALLDVAMCLGRDRALKAYMDGLQGMVSSGHVTRAQALTLLRGNAGGSTALLCAMERRQVGAMTIYMDGIRAMMDRDYLDREVAMPLLQACARWLYSPREGRPDWVATAYMDGLRAMADTGHLNRAHVEELLTAREFGKPGLHIAMSEGSVRTVMAYMTGVRTMVSRHLLTGEQAMELLRAANADGVTGLRRAEQNGHNRTVMVYMDGVHEMQVCGHLSEEQAEELLRPT